MIKLNFAKYKDKVKACWIGKNIGGTIGTPYEACREYLSVEGFSTPKGTVLANDDLDLQLVWLNAVEKLGMKGINSTSLGEFWLSFVGPYWNEYGIGKANMKAGILPPLSGDYHNEWKHSNGAWIRTEIWACLQPGRPDVALEYAVEDAQVDHGSGEGTYAAAFVATMQSCAFVFDDIRTCIDIALSKIPQDCRVATTIRKVIQCYESKMEVREARDTVLNMNSDIGDGWFEAPSNVGYVVLGLLYGEGDFKKSILYAVNCGDDTDCTGATVGATLGILYGTKELPKDWVEYIGDKIESIAIMTGMGAVSYPKTCSELTERVVALAPNTVNCRLDWTFSNVGSIAYKNEYVLVRFTDGDDEIPANMKESYISFVRGREVMDKLRPNTINVEMLLAKAYVTMVDGIDITPNGELRVKIEFEHNRDVFGIITNRLSLRWWLPEGFTVSGKNFVCLPTWRSAHSAVTTEEYVIKAGEKVEAVNDVVIEVKFDGRVYRGYIHIPLMG